jgi:hypothetical protein
LDLVNLVAEGWRKGAPWCWDGLANLKRYFRY